MSSLVSGAGRVFDHNGLAFGFPWQGLAAVPRSDAFPHRLVETS